MVKLRAVLFDYGHTLVYFPHIGRTHMVAAKNIQKEIKNLGISADAFEIRTIIDTYAHPKSDIIMSIEDEFKEILRRLGVEKVSSYLLQKTIDIYGTPYVQKAQLRKGTKELLNNLRRKGLKLGIVANIWSCWMNPVLEREEISKLFDTIICSLDVGLKKPYSQIFQIALNKLDVSSQEAIMVGDSPENDIEGAYNLGLTTVRLIRGPNKRKPDIVKPDFKIRNLTQLYPIIENLIVHS